MTIRLRVIGIATTTTLAALATPASGHAQATGLPGFRIEACQGKDDPRGAGFADFKTRDMVVKRACTPYGKGVRGMVLSVSHSGKRGARVRRGSVARLAINAPPGTAIASAAWSGGAVRSDCGYTMDVFADGSQRDWTLYDTNKCPRPGRAQSSGDRREVANNINASRIVLRVICTSSGCSRRGSNYLRTSSVALHLVDTQDPTVNITSAPGGWVNGDQALGYTAADNAGLANVQRSGGRLAGDDFNCVLITTTPCPRQVADSIPLDTSELGEGTQAISVAARDVSGRTGASPAATVHIDRSPPDRVETTLAGGDQWRPSSAFQVGWTNPAEVDRAPIVAASYELCPTGNPAGCITRRVAGDGIGATSIEPPSPGEWSARIWREDAAGNQSQSLASDAVTLRWDPTPPDVAFEPTSSNDPTQVAVRATDAVSGVAGGGIEISREGSGSWQQVAATLTGGRLVGRIADTNLPAGRYELRAHASDQAGNEKSAPGPTVQLPLRVASTMRAGKAQTKVVRRRVRRHGKRRTLKRRTTTYRSSARVAYGRTVRLRGRLSNSHGDPISGPVAVYEQSPVAPSRLVAIVPAGAKGRFAYRARGTTSKTVTFVYLGTGTVLPASRQVRVAVPASSTMRASKRKLLNGQRLTFSGRVRTRPIPAAGKLLAVQALITRPGHRKRWATFRNVRTDAAGRWSTPYRFTATCERRKRWRLRVVIPAESGVPFANGRSRVISVLVRGNGSC